MKLNTTSVSFYPKHAHPNAPLEDPVTNEARTEEDQEIFQAGSRNHLD
jgi:hypothetical protein